MTAHMWSREASSSLTQTQTQTHTLSLDLSFPHTHTLLLPQPFSLPPSLSLSPLSFFLSFSCLLMFNMTLCPLMNCQHGCRARPAQERLHLSGRQQQRRCTEGMWHLFPPRSTLPSAQPLTTPAPLFVCKHRTCKGSLRKRPTRFSATALKRV